MKITKYPDNTSYINEPFPGVNIFKIKHYENNNNGIFIYSNFYIITSIR